MREMHIMYVDTEEQAQVLQQRIRDFGEGHTGRMIGGGWRKECVHRPCYQVHLTLVGEWTDSEAEQMRGEFLNYLTIILHGQLTEAIAIIRESLHDGCKCGSCNRANEYLEKWKV